MTDVETRAYEENGVNATSKHYIARGGRSSYSSAKSIADLWKSYMVGWKAAVDAGTSWVMMNNSVGLNEGLVTLFDSETVGYLRNELGYDGVIVTDWPLFMGGGPKATGITVEGEDLSLMTPGQIYTKILSVGIDQFGTGCPVPGTDIQASLEKYNGVSGNCIDFPDILKEAVEDGTCSIELIDRSVTRILRNKFELGLFEDPYRDWEEAKLVFASDAFITEEFPVTSVEDIILARNDYLNLLDERIQTESAILLKNDDNILPLQNDAKVYVISNSAAINAADITAIAEHSTIVERMDDADVVIAHVTALDDAYKVIIEDAQDTGKPVILVLEGTVSLEPGTYETDNCAAILVQVYRKTQDHGSSVGNFYTYTRPDITADMLFGKREPTGSTVFEIARNSNDAALDFADLQLDIGVDTKTRLYMVGTVRQNPTAVIPNNLGDVLYPNGFGLQYGQDAQISLNTLVVPQIVTTEERQSPWGGAQLVTVAANAPQKAGVPFEIYLIAQNDGVDGYTTVQVYEGNTLLASKFVTVEGKSFVVVSIEIAIDSIGEHTITVNDLSTAIIIE
jgi:beta-glucosidase-like glycosyl hydrolase